LPPPRPIVDRGPIINDANDPVTARRLAAITLGEANPGASTAELQQQYETAPNRAMQTGSALPNVIKTYNGPRSGGYYPAEAIARGEQMLQQPGAYESFQERVAKPILRGATDPLGLGFTPTQNASLGVASRGAASGRYDQFGRSPTGELFATKPGEVPPTPFPAGGPDTPSATAAIAPDVEQGRNALAAELTPPPPAPFTQMASLGGGGIGGLPATAGAPPITPAAAPIPAGVPPAPPVVPQGNPPIVTSQITPRPPPVAQAQVPSANPPFVPRTTPLSDVPPPKQTQASPAEQTTINALTRPIKSQTMWQGTARTGRAPCIHRQAK
jgi:hypothetical protein